MPHNVKRTYNCLGSLPTELPESESRIQYHLCREDCKASPQHSSSIPAEIQISCYMSEMTQIVKTTWPATVEEAASVENTRQPVQHGLSAMRFGVLCSRGTPRAVDTMQVFASTCLHVHQSDPSWPKVGKLPASIAPTALAPPLMCLGVPKGLAYGSVMLILLD